MIILSDNWHFHQLYREYFKTLNIFSLNGNLFTVSCCINSSDIKSRECVVSVLSITSTFWNLESNQDEDEGADFERKASNLDSIRALSKTKGMGKSRVWKQPATPATNNDLIGWENNSSWWQTNHKKTVKMNPKRRVCKIINFQKAGVMLWQSTVLRRLWHRITDVHSKMQTSDQHQT